MAFDQETRNRLARFVLEARRLIAAEFTQKLQSLYGISEKGVLTPMEELGHLDDAGLSTAALLRERIAYLIRTHPEEKDGSRTAVARLAREQAFTVLNRLAAVRMAEKRGLIVESVGRGYQSKGFLVFSQVAGSALGETFERYRRYLFCLFDELAVDLGSLFDRRAPQSLLFPRETALLDLLKLLNAPELEALWAEDETIGWIYQYYNDPAERKKMREESAAPRNSREMAVRNQFFTPRYVVEFLTDNTLGRLWYEMTKGQTRLREQCRYLIRRPVEIFLPNPATTFWHSAAGHEEFQRFSTTGHPADLPDYPSLGVLFGWLAQLTQPATPYFNFSPETSLRGLGFEPCLTAVGIHPAALISHWSSFLAGNLSRADPVGAQTIELLHLLWYSAARRAISGDSTWASIDPVTAEPPVAALWNTLRARLISPPTGLSQEELLRQPVFIPHRAAKDPREIRMLDPACGSMHFGLYAFDLLEVIYSEAWEMKLLPDGDFGGTPPPFPHASIRFDSSRHTAHSNDLHTDIPTAGARVVVLRTADEGDGLFTTGPYLTSPERKFRPGTAHDLPLAEFDYPLALSKGWFTPAAGEKFVRETGCWHHDRADALPPEEVDAAFRIAIPRLIIGHNIHGVDIDPRAAQIAGLSLWLRAQRAWHEAGVRPDARLRITRANIVCAEPMPGDKSLLREFTAREFVGPEQGVFQGLLAAIFDSMELAGEAGSLLRIEDEITSAIDLARNAWQALRTVPAELFSDAELNLFSQQPELPIQPDLRSLPADFWSTAETRLLEALRAFAESAGGNYQRRLFADDAARGFAFIDLCRQRYDVALMNPPFGDASLPSKPYIDETYGDTKGDVYKAFVECFHARLVPAGYLGIISSRTGFFLSQSEDWRTRVVLRLFRPIALADLGSGVLDAMVEVAAYVLRSLSVREARDLTLSIVPVLEKVVSDSQDCFSLPKWQAARGGLKRHQAVAELEHLEAHGFVQRSSGETIRYSPLWHSVKKVTAPAKPVFPPLVCVRALVEREKRPVLVGAIAGSQPGSMFICDPARFNMLPGRPFAYWGSDRVLDLFEKLGDMTSRGAQTKCGLGTLDDFRFLRLWWECTDRSHWIPLAKGGAFSPWYASLPLTLGWGTNGSELKCFVEAKVGSASRKVQAQEFYFRPGITWPRRTNGLSFRPFPKDAIFGDKGPAAFSLNDSSYENLLMLAIMNSAPFGLLVALQLARVSLAQSFEVGVIQRTPFPQRNERTERELVEKAQIAWAEKRGLDSTTPISHAFLLPAPLAAPASTLTERAAAWAACVRTSEETVAAIQAEIDDLAFCLYGLNAGDRAALTTTLVTETTGDAEAETGEVEEEKASTADAPALTADLLAYALGCVFGRWDIRYATGERPAPAPPDPFAPLPVCPPGMLQNAAGLPDVPGDVPASYPVRITWPGLLVDDLAHPEDIEGRVREVLAVLFPDRVEAIADEACALLGVKSLHEWFRRPAGFFADHLKRYSKSRRQAPIYWPLSTASGGYTLWIYYHRLTDQTLHACLADFVLPKIKSVEQDLSAARDTNQSQRAGELQEFLDELHGLREELERVIRLPWKPNLNDGVLITASPLWKLFRLGKWQKDLKACWQELEAGKYDWAHLAHTIWPQRVEKVCETDRSIAIAHSLEHLCKIEPPKPKGKKKAAAKKRASGSAAEEPEMFLE